MNKEDMFRVTRIHENATYLSSGCIESKYYLNEKYPRINISGKLVKISRYLFHLRWPDFRLNDEDLYICHTCDNPRCINLEHLRAGTPHFNSNDSVEKGRHYNANKTQCKYGHGEYNKDRRCSKCNRIKSTRYYRRKTIEEKATSTSNPS